MPSTLPQIQESRASVLIRELFESGRPLAYIRTVEEQRVARVLREVGERIFPGSPLPVWTWSLTEGLHLDGAEPLAGAHDPAAALEFIHRHAGSAIFHLKDFHEPLRDSAAIRRLLRDLYEAALDKRKFLVITSPVHSIPEELDRTMLFVELRLPDVVELTAFVSEEGSIADAELAGQIARTLQGLTLDESRYALRRATTGNRVLGGDSMPRLLEEKRLLVNRTGVIEFIADPTDMSIVGGLDTLKKWLFERRKLFQLRESLTMELVPKGLLMMGIPGCGKSLAVKAIASSFELPLYRLDMIEIFSGRHGKPEGVFVQACKMMEDMAPAILWFDEIEMGINSTDSGGEQGRVFAFFLTWMQEKTRGLFVAATANRLDLLPAEMIRKGRFDEVFFVDLPTEEERLAIFDIHLTRRGENPRELNIPQLMEFTLGWTGAEIEQCVVSALTRARLDDRRVTSNDMLTSAVAIVPLSRTMKEQIDHIRGWAFERAVRATPRSNTGR